MFIQTSRKALLATSALGTVAILYLAIVLCLGGITTWAERDLDAFPFKQEDWLRYLVPTYFVGTEKPRMLLAGPSTVRENLLYEQFKQQFHGYRIIQGGISLGTLDDITAALQYIEKVYGKKAMPRVVVVGISPRFISNTPHDRPFSLGLNLYSPYYGARESSTGLRLEKKNTIDSLVSRSRFMLNKDPERFRTALLAAFYHLVLTQGNKGPDGKTWLQARLDQLFKTPFVSQRIGNTRYRRALDYDFSEVVAWLFSPYKYRLDKKIDINGLIKWMNEKDSWWQIVHTWDPEKSRDVTVDSLKRFNEIIRTYNVKLVVVNMPERDASRVRYDKDHYQAYINVVRNTLDNALFLDLREFLNTPEFHDLEHSIYPGSLRLTREIIRHMKQSPGFDTPARGQ